MKFITGNKNKFFEIRKLIPNVEQLELDLVEIQENDAQKIIESKLIEAKKYCSDNFFIEDTSLHVDCLNGLPGPLIKWFLEALTQEGLYELVAKYDDNSATAKTIIGLCYNDEFYFFEGVTKGNIVSAKKTDFGWDGIFMPKGSTLRYSQMTVDEKNKISHRYKAIRKLQEFLALQQ